MENNIESGEEALKPKRFGASIMYLVIVGVVFAVMTIVFVFLPRSEYSELEKRDLKEFPNIDDYDGKPGEYTTAISEWFSDTEPFRDELMTLSMNIRSAMRGNIFPEEESVSFRPSTASADAASAADGQAGSLGVAAADSTGHAPSADEGVAKIGDAGIVIVGKGDNVRALMAFGGSADGGGGYVSLLNTLAESFPSQRIYAMVAPLASEFYMPEKAKKVSKPQKPFIYSIRDRLNGRVKFVDVYDELSKHTNEDIYLRTDHHWAGLGGYYAAKRLAQTAGVPFRDLIAYEKREVKGFVGSMYGYSHDISVKNAPEDFVYYVPNQVKYEAEFVAYTLNKDFKITRESKPYKSSFFKSFKNGSGNAYLTFIGSDQVFVKVKTSTPGNRRLLIIKDSYGNAVPGNLFYSFSEVHVVDFRYFTHNLRKYVADNGITDIAVCFNVFNAYSNGSASKVKTMLTQAGGIQARPDDPHGQSHSDSVKSKTSNVTSKPTPIQDGGDVKPVSDPVPSAADKVENEKDESSKQPKEEKEESDNKTDQQE